MSEPGKVHRKATLFDLTRINLLLLIKKFLAADCFWQILQIIDHQSTKFAKVAKRVFSPKIAKKTPEICLRHLSKS